jgi:hypothetical protein
MSEQVVVGEARLTLKTSTLAQQARLGEALKAVQIDRVVSALRPFLVGIEPGEFWNHLSSNAESLYALAIDVLTTNGAAGLAKACGALLDNRENFVALKNAALVSETDAEFAGSRFIRCPAVSAFVEAEVTFEQAVEIVRAAFRLNRYGEMGKALFAGLNPAKANETAPLPN